jgi:putative ABC transport system permease protein
MFVNELLYAIRVLVRQARSTLLIVCFLGLGLGLTAALLGIVNAVLSSPFPSTGRLAWIWERSDFTNLLLTPNEYESLQNTGKTFTGLAAYTQFKGADYITQDDSLYPISSCSITPNLFSVLGYRPEKGLGISRNDPGNVAVLSWNLWKTVFHGEPNIIGQTVKINGFSFLVKGVMSQDFSFPANVDVWLPLDLNIPYLREDRRLHVIGRLADGIEQSKVQAALDVAAATVKRQTSSSTRTVFQTSSFMEGLLANLSSMLEIARTLAISVFLLVVANATVLFLLGARRRSHALTTRLALGAKVGSIVRESAFEALLICLCGGVLALGAASVFFILVNKWSINLLPAYTHMRMTVLLGYVALFAAISTLCLSIMRAVETIRPGTKLLIPRREEDHANRSLRSRFFLLLAVEIGATTALLLVCALSVRRFERLRTMSLGISSDHLVQTQLYIPGIANKTQSQKSELLTTVLRQVSSSPAVHSGTAGLMPALQNFIGQTSVRPDKSSATQVHVDIKPVTTGYFQTMGIPLFAGRDFTPEEMGNGSAVIVDHATAERLWGKGAPPGESISFGRGSVRLVGIAGNTNYFGESVPTVYIPLTNSISNGQSFLLLHLFLKQDQLDLEKLRSSVQENARNITPGATIGSMSPVAEEFHKALVTPRVQAGMSLLMGAVAITVAVLGLYGITAYTIMLQRRTIAIRVALGAMPMDIVGTMFRWLLYAIAVGFATGLVGGVIVDSVAAPGTSGVNLYDPVSIGSVLLIIAVLVLAGTGLPAWLAARVNPQVYLRLE